MKATRIESIKIERTIDDNPDYSWIGEYTDELCDGVIVREFDEFYEKLPQDTEMPERGREYRAFRPYAGGEKPGTDDYYRYGRQDYDRMEDYNRGGWCFVGVRAVATVYVNNVRQELSSGGLWGIESDSGNEYFAQVAGEQIAELREVLESLGFAKSAISKAFHKVENVEA